MRNSHPVSSRSFEQIIQAIFELDLEIVKQQLCDAEDGEGWTVDQANHYEMEYKQFLALAVKYPEKDISPSRNVDSFWHAHILNTRKYAQDCEHTFGYFVHHYPSARNGEKAEQARYEQSFSKFQALREQEFPGASQLSLARGEKAFCGLQSSEPGRQAAFCGLQSAPKESMAFCGLQSAEKNAPAFCGLQSRNQEKAAFCGLQSMKQNEQTAFCGLQTHPASESPAFCGLQSAGKEDKVAFCGLSAARAPSA